jgi:hypothetical protein
LSRVPIFTLAAENSAPRAKIGLQQRIDEKGGGGAVRDGTAWE